MFSKLVSASLFAGLSAAQTFSYGPMGPPLPMNGQIGALHFPVKCSFLDFLSSNFSGLYTATAPIAASSGQQIYYTDVTAALTIPKGIIDLGAVVGATQARAIVQVGLELTHATVTDFAVFPNNLIIQNITLVPGQDLTVHVPFNKNDQSKPLGVLPPIGPVTLSGNKGDIHDIRLGAVDLQIYIQNAAGHDILGPLPINCPTQTDPDLILGIVNIDGQSNTAPLKIGNGFDPGFPETDIDYESGSFRFEYACDFQGLGVLDLDLTIGGTVKAYYAPGEQFYITNSQNYLKLPPSIVQAATSLYRGTTQFTTSITDFEITISNASPASLNVLAGRPVTVTSSAKTGKTVVIDVPQTGDLTIGPFSATGAAGSYVYISVGTSKASVAFKNGSGKTIKTLPVSCKPKYPASLIGIPISNKVPGQ